MNYEQHKEELLAHYIRLAQNPAMKAHAWHQVNYWAKEWPTYYADLPARLTAAMTKDKP